VLASEPEDLRDMRMVGRARQGRHGPDALRPGAAMPLGKTIIEGTCRIPLPVDHAKPPPDGLPRVTLHGHQMIDPVGVDDAAGGVPDRAQCVDGDDPFGKGHLPGSGYTALLSPSPSLNS